MRKTPETRTAPRPRRWLIVAGAAAGLYLAWWAFGLLRGPAPPEDIAKRAVEALIRGDADAIYSLISEEELKQTGVTKQGLKRFVDGFVAPRLRGFEQVGEMQVKKSGFADMDVAVECRLEKGDRYVDLSFTACAAGSGDAKLRYAIFTIFNAAHMAGLPAGPHPKGKGRQLAWVKTINANLDAFRADGVNGFTTPSTYDPTGTYYTWELFAERQSDLAALRNIDKWRNYGKK